MELKVAERLMLLNILPQEGDIVILRVVRDAQSAIGLTEEELAALELKQEEGRVVWKSEADVPKDITIGPRVVSIIVEKLTKLNEEKKLTLQQLALYEKFVEPPEPDEKVRPIKK